MKARLDDLERELWTRMRDQGRIKWTAKSGKEIPIRDMTDKHLLNAIMMLYRQEGELEHIGDIDILDYYD